MNTTYTWKCDWPHPLHSIQTWSVDATATPWALTVSATDTLWPSTPPRGQAEERERTALILLWAAKVATTISTPTAPPEVIKRASKRVVSSHTPSHRWSIPQPQTWAVISHTQGACSALVKCRLTEAFSAIFANFKVFLLLKNWTEGISKFPH